MKLQASNKDFLNAISINWVWHFVKSTPTSLQFINVTFCKVVFASLVRLKLQ